MDGDINHSVAQISQNYTEYVGTNSQSSRSTTACCDPYYCLRLTAVRCCASCATWSSDSNLMQNRNKKFPQPPHIPELVTFLWKHPEPGPRERCDSATREPPFSRFTWVRLVVRRSRDIWNALPPNPPWIAWRRREKAVYGFLAPCSGDREQQNKHMKIHGGYYHHVM